MGIFNSVFRRPAKRGREEAEGTAVGAKAPPPAVIDFNGHTRPGIQYGATYLYYEKALTLQDPNVGHAKYCVHVKASATETFTAAELVGVVRAGHLARKPTLFVCREDIVDGVVRADQCVVARWIASPL